MSALTNYRNRLKSSANTDGQYKKKSSDYILEATWNGDIQSKKAYIYDYYHDDEPLNFLDLHPEKSSTKTPINIKFIVDSYNSESRDIVGYHIQFKPSFNWKEESSLSYYNKKFVDTVHAEFPIGLYIDIPDEKGNYRKWLITETANNLGNQFPTWYVLPIDYIFQWVNQGIKYQMCGVSRSQNSYNAGEWSDRVFTLPENQRKCLLPMNDISSTIFYNQRLVISAPIKTPIVWHCSKVEQLNPPGISRLTFAQELWDEHTDVFEYQDIATYETRISSKFEYNPEKEKVIAMWASYTDVPIKDDDYENRHGEITFSGLKPEIKIGGGYKKFIINFYDSEDNPIDYPSDKYLGEWRFELNDVDITHSDLLETQIVENINNEIKVKFIGNDTYIGSIIKVIHNSFNNITTTLEVKLAGL